MELKKGYKQTEVGLIPEDWQVKSISEITSISVGRDLKTNHYSSYQDDIFKYPVYSNTVSNFGLYGYYDIADYEGASLTIVGRGVGLGKAFARIGGFGAIGRLLVLFPTNNVDPFFLSEYINNRITVFSESGGVPQLTGLSIAKYKVPIPPTIQEQIAITNALSNADALINGLEKLIEKKRNIKQGAMQELLRPKEGWEVKKLGEFVNISSGESPSKFKFRDSGVPYFKVDQLNNSNKYQWDTPYFIESEIKIPKGSIIFPKRGASILTNKVRILVHDSFMDTNLMTLTTCLGIDNEYLYYVLIFNELWRIADTTSIPQINNKHINPYEIYVPGLEEQKGIAIIIREMDIELEALQTKLEKYRNMKVGMMQELLTGKIRLV